MPVVHLGNTAALDRGTTVPGDQVTTAHVPDAYTSAERLAVIVAEVARGATQDGVWRTHSTATVPLWVESDDPVLADAIAEHYGCPVGRPDDWEPVG